MTATITNACRLCDGKTSNILDLGWTPLANALCDEPTLNVPRYPLALARCDHCGHFQLPVEVDARELFPPTYPYASGASASMRAHLDGVAELIAKRLPGNARVLEIGCNDGYLLDRMRDLGLSVVGVDPASTPRNYVIAEPMGRYLLDKNKTRLRPHSFDAVIGLNVFAHMTNLGLDDAMHASADLLKPDGLLFMEVGYFGAMVEQNVFDTIYHEHLDYHTLGALVPFLERFGFTAFDAERIPVQGGSIRVWASNDGPHLSSEVERLVREERETLSDLSGYEDAVCAARHWTNGLSATLGYGCPAKATTLTAFGAYGVRGYVDDNPLKVGKYAPDGATPIMPNSSALDEWLATWYRSREPISVLVFAWNMLDEILPKIRNSPAQCLRDARVLVPFPEPHYVE